MKLLSIPLFMGLVASGHLVNAAPVPASSSISSPGATQTPAAFLLAIPSDAEYSPSILPAGNDSFTALNKKYKRYIKGVLESRSYGHSCNTATVQIRKEWGFMATTDRNAYIDAVKCLYHLPAKSKPLDVPGARSRFDDYVAAHVIQVNSIHYNGNLYPWHRHFTWLYDQALRNECGYNGPTPYWDWTLYEDPRRSPVFDGNDSSMGGNGDYYPHGETYVHAFGKDLVLPPGTGGGCVTSGPFTDLLVNLGLTPNITNSSIHFPKSPAGNPPATVGSIPALQYNPRCLHRDINLSWSTLTTPSAVKYLLACPDAKCLEQRADGWEEGASAASQAVNQLHNVGHLAVGGVQNDQLVSPSDPAFFLHHAMMDRLWAVWQAQDPGKRVYEVGGTQTPYNDPPSAEVRIDDMLPSFATIGKPVTHRDVASTVDGPYCYMYT